MVDFTSSQRAEIEVVVRENLTAQLNALGKALQEGAKKTHEADTTFEKLKKTISGPAGTAAAVIGFSAVIGKMFLEFGEARAQLNLFAESSRVSVRDITALESTMKIAGATSEQARAASSGMINTLKDLWLNGYGSGAANQLSQYGVEGQKMAARLVEAMRTGNPKDGINQLIKEYDEGTPRAREALSQFFHIPEPLLHALLDGLKEQYDRIPDQDDKAAIQMSERWNQFKIDMTNNVWNPMINEAEKAILSIAKMVGINFDNLEGAKDKEGKEGNEGSKEGPAPSRPAPPASFRDRWNAMQQDKPMAEGGAVMGPVRALIGEKEPELVIPFSKLKDLQGMIGNSPIKPAGGDDLQMLNIEQDMARMLGDVRDTLQRMENNPLTPFAEGGIVTKPTRALVGEAGPELILPLRMGASGIGRMFQSFFGGGTSGHRTGTGFPSISFGGHNITRMAGQAFNLIHNVWGGGGDSHSLPFNLPTPTIPNQQPMPSLGSMMEGGFAAMMDQTLSRKRSGQVGTVSADVEFSPIRTASGDGAPKNVFLPIILSNLVQAQQAEANTSEPYPWATSS